MKTSTLAGPVAAGLRAGRRLRGSRFERPHRPPRVERSRFGRPHPVTVATHHRGRRPTMSVGPTCVGSAEQGVGRYGWLPQRLSRFESSRRRPFRGGRPPCRPTDARQCSASSRPMGARNASRSADTEVGRYAQFRDSLSVPADPLGSGDRDPRSSAAYRANALAATGRHSADSRPHRPGTRAEGRVADRPTRRRPAVPGPRIQRVKRARRCRGTHRSRSPPRPRARSARAAGPRRRPRAACGSRRWVARAAAGRAA